MNKKSVKDIYSDARYDSRYDSRCKLYIQETVELILKYKYGETVPFDIVAKSLHYNIEDEKEKQKFDSAMGRIKNFLVEYGYILKSIRGLGYYILKPKQISGYCYHTYIRRTLNLLEKSDKILQHVDTWDLSEIRKQEHQEVQTLNKNTISVINNADRLSDYKKHKEEYDQLKD